MSHFKYYSVFLVAAASCGISHAGAMGDANQGFSVNKLYFTGSALYGKMTDDGVDRTNFVSSKPAPDGITSINGTTENFQPNINSNWGYQFVLGYRLGANNKDDISLSYLNLHNSGFRVVNSQPGDVLTNLIDPLPLTNSANHFINGAASAEAKFLLQTGDLLRHFYRVSEKFSDIEYSYFYGIKMAGINKNFNASYSGTQTNDDRAITGPYNSSLQYENKLFGIGPKIGMGAAWNFYKHLSINGDLSAALLGGTQNSQFTQSKTAEVNITRNFIETHNNSIWVPIVVGGNLSLAAIFDAPKQTTLKLEGGVGGESYVPEHLTDTYNSVKFNNTLNFINTFIKVTYSA